VANQPRRLCIISSDLFRSGQFITALGESLRHRPQESLAIILDRRHGNSSTETIRENRRRQALVDRALATNGFAIVPASVDSEDRSSDPSIELLLRADEEDRRRLESILSFQQRQSGRRHWKLGDAFAKAFQMPQKIVTPRTLLSLAKLLAVFICVAMAWFAVALSGHDLAKNFLGWVPRESPPTVGDQAGAPPAATLPPKDQTRTTTGDASTIAQVPEVSYPLSGSPSTGGPTSPKQAPLRKEMGPQPKATEGQVGNGRRSHTVTARSNRRDATESTSVVGKTSPHGATPKASPPRLADSPRAELAREPQSVGWGDSYAVRLSTPAGQPMVVTEIVLVARMADGTVENIAMGALPERGIYRATVPSSRSALVNLQVRVKYGEKRVKIPVRR